MGQKKDLSGPGTLNQLGDNIGLIWDLLRDRREPFHLKLLPAIGIMWLLFPDLAPGPVDDAIAVFITSFLFIELSPKELVAELRRKRRKQKSDSSDDGDVIDADWKDAP